MGGYLETKTAEKLQGACDAIKKASNVYVISELYKLGFITERKARNQFEIMGVKLDESEDKREDDILPWMQYMPFRLYADIFGEATYAPINQLFGVRYVNGAAYIPLDQIAKLIIESPSIRQAMNAFVPLTGTETRYIRELQERVKEMETKLGMRSESKSASL